jgi:hypothetical protein
MRIRPGLIVASIFAALVPFASVAQAATNEDVIAQQKAAAMQATIVANTLNDLARCKMAAAGQTVPGTVAFSQPAPTLLVNACTPTGGTSGGATPTVSQATTNANGLGCVTNSRSLTTFEANAVNDWAISVQKAIANKQSAPTMPAFVAALIGAC